MMSPLTFAGTIALVVLVIFLFLRRFVATVIPTLSCRFR